jgi:hypothetical protein
MHRVRAMLALMVLGSSTAMADTPLYVALPLPQRPIFTGCSIAATRDALIAGLKRAGYSGSLPKIGWATNRAAVLLLSTDGSQKPYTYYPGNPTLQVVVQRVPASAQNYLFVMEIDKSAAAATSCQLADAGTVVPGVVSKTARPPTYYRGSASGTAASSR